MSGVCHTVPTTTTTNTTAICRTSSHTVRLARTQLPLLLRKSRLVSFEQETNCSYNGRRQDGHKEKSCGENHALSTSVVINDHVLHTMLRLCDQTMCTPNCWGEGGQLLCLSVKVSSPAQVSLAQSGNYAALWSIW